jgi:hypothetical protein
MPAVLYQIEIEFRRAIEGRRFAEAQRLSDSLCKAAELHAKALPPGHPDIRRIGDWLQETLEWARLMICVFRASLAADLRALPILNRYLTSSTPAYSIAVDI